MVCLSEPSAVCVSYISPAQTRSSQCRLGLALQITVNNKVRLIIRRAYGFHSAEAAPGPSHAVVWPRGPAATSRSGGMSKRALAHSQSGEPHFGPHRAAPSATRLNTYRRQFGSQPVDAGKTDDGRSGKEVMAKDGGSGLTVVLHS